MNVLAEKGFKGWVPARPSILVDVEPDLIVTSFFNEGYISQSSIAQHHSIYQKVLEATPGITIPGRLWTCAGPHLIEAAEQLADALEEPDTQKLPPHPPKGGRTMRRGQSSYIMLLLWSALVLVFLLALSCGESFLSPLRVLKALWGRGEARDILIVQDIRAPRAVLAILTGAGLGAAGAALQGYFRNPLADPGITGVSAVPVLARFWLFILAGLLRGVLHLLFQHF